MQNTINSESNSVTQDQEPITIQLSCAEFELINAAVEAYRELVGSPTSSARDARGDEWVDNEVRTCDQLLLDKLSSAPQTKVTTYAGFFNHDDLFIELGFQAPANASQPQLDAAFLAALAQQAEIDYLAIGDES